MAGRASIVGAAATHVGKVRDHNEDAHFIDVDLGVFLVCDGMGGHAAGEVASALAIEQIRTEWSSEALHSVAERWLDQGTPETKKKLIEVLRAGVTAAHDAILAEARRDLTKSGMGTTLVGAMVVGGELVFAHAGDSRAYLVRDGISMQLTEDHTLLARLLAAGIDVDVSGEGSRFRSMLTNALGIGDECKVSTFVVPLADGDRFLLCSDGISEYVPENEVGDVLTGQSSPSRAAQRLVELALERGGGDNATAVVVRVLEAGETPLPAEQRKKDDAAISACALWGARVTPQQRLRALRIAIPRDHAATDRLPPRALGDRVAWIIVEGELVQDGAKLGPGALIYPESLLSGREPVALPERDALAVARSEVRALAIRADDFRELCDDDGELGEALLEGLAGVIGRRRPRLVARDHGHSVDPRGHTDPQLPTVEPADPPEAYRATDPDLRAVADLASRDRAATVPDMPHAHGHGPVRPAVLAESPIIAPAPPRAPPPVQAPTRPSPVPAPLTRRAGPAPEPPARPSPVPAAMRPDRAADPGPPSRPSPVPAAARPGPPSRPSPVPAAARPGPPSRPSPVPAAARPGPPSRPSPPPPPGARDRPQDGRAPSRPSPPPPPRSSTGQAATPKRPAPTSAQAHAAAALPHTPAPVHELPKAPTPTAPRVVGGAAPEHGAGKQPPASSPPVGAAATQSDGWTTTARRAQPDPRWDSTSPHADAAASSRSAAQAAPKGFAPALAHPASARPSALEIELDGAPQAERRRPPTDPEIETYFEIEADLPPEHGDDPEIESEMALGIALGAGGPPDDDDEQVSITIVEDGARVTKTITETSAHTLTVTVTEPGGDDDRRWPRAITAEDGTAVSGTISIPEERAAPPRRAKRHSEVPEE